MEKGNQITPGSINLIFTSPPYWSLRDYGEETVTLWSENEYCEHDWIKAPFPKKFHSEADPKFAKGIKNPKGFSYICSKCKSYYGQLGLEPNIQLYLHHLWQISDILFNLLNKDGLMFWNHGDSYGGFGIPNKSIAMQNERFALGILDPEYRAFVENKIGVPVITQPQRRIRNRIIWWKPNARPRPGSSRFTDVYEPVYMFQKGQTSNFCIDDIRLPYAESSKKRVQYAYNELEQGGAMSTRGRKKFADDLKNGKAKGKNPGDVWIISTEPSKGSHGAPFPRGLVRPIIIAGCPENGTILDPFGGGGTVSFVAEERGLNSIIVDISPIYCKEAYDKLIQQASQSKLTHRSIVIREGF